MGRGRGWRIGVVGWLLLMALGACAWQAPAPRPLESQTIARGSESGWRPLEPGVILVSNREEVKLLTGFLSAEVLEQVAAVNFRTYVVIAAFQGWQPSFAEGTGIEVVEVQRRPGEYLLHARVPDGGQGAEASPYHLIQVDLATVSGSQGRVTLFINGRVVVSR